MGVILDLYTFLGLPSYFSPRTWGLSLIYKAAVQDDNLFPTHMGVILDIRFSYQPIKHFPNIHGGYPAEAGNALGKGHFSPLHGGYPKIASRSY